MTIAIVVPLLVCIVGGLIALLASAQRARLGEIAFFCGLFWLVYVAMTHVVHGHFDL